MAWRNWVDGQTVAAVLVTVGCLTVCAAAGWGESRFRCTCGYVFWRKLKIACAFFPASC